jgi:hypothetical protein
MAMQRGACGAVARFACEAIWGMLPPQNLWRSSWIPGSYVPTLSKHRHSFLPLLKKKGSQEGSALHVMLGCRCCAMVD